MMQRDQKLLPPPRVIEYKVTDMPDGTFKLFAIDVATYAETEEALIENVHFTSVADLLKFVALHYPGAKEVMD
jgi:hypothetical protein